MGLPFFIDVPFRKIVSLAKISAGIILYRNKNRAYEFFLIHPGGPFWRNKDIGAWSIPKGEIGPGEQPLTAAIRELKEETGISISGDFIELSPVKMKSGKIIRAWAKDYNTEIEKIESNTFNITWPPKSGKQITIPEIDMAEWFQLETAIKKINSSQIPLLIELNKILSEI